MAKFCGNCGAQMEDNAKVCGQCGTPFDGSIVYRPEKKAMAPEKKKKLIKCIAIAALAVAVLVVSIVIISNNTGTKGLVRKVMTAFEKYDDDTLISLASDAYFSDEWDEYPFLYDVEDTLDDFAKHVGHNYKFSYEIKEIYSPLEYQRDDIIDWVKYKFSNYDTEKIKDLAVAEVTVTAKQGGKSDEENIDILMIKENGTWRLLNID